MTVCPIPAYGDSPSRFHRAAALTRSSSEEVSLLRRMSLVLMLWTGAPGDRRKVDGASPSR